MNTLHQLGALLFALTMPIAPAYSADSVVVGEVLKSPAPMTANSDRAVFLDVARAGDRVVAVGERGLVLFSDDNGQHWLQAKVPVSVSLTAVQFVDKNHGWAVGHSGAVLVTRDGGETWQIQLDGLQAAKLELEAAQAEKSAAADQDAAEARIQTAERLVAEGADKPFLALAFSDAKHGIVVGAYGLAFQTDDGGATWHSAVGQIENPMGLHIYAITHHDKQWFIAGEQGFLARSNDGLIFKQLESPYSGTFFTLGLRHDGGLLIGGLKGHAFLLPAGSDVAVPLPVLAPVSFSDSLELSDNRVLLSNQAGGLFVSPSENSSVIKPALPPTGKPVSGAVQAADGTLVIAGFTGLSRVSLPAASASE